MSVGSSGTMDAMNCSRAYFSHALVSLGSVPVRKEP